MNIPENSDVRILYIGGSIRSGSTILSMLLGANSGMFAVGEIQVIFRLLLETSYQLKCSCGETLSNCPFWSQVLDRFHAALPDMSDERAAAIIRKVASTPERWIGASVYWDDYRKIWQTLFGAVTAVSGASTLIDSSKTGRGALSRPLNLARCGFDVRLLHLLRDPRAVAWSILRREIDKGQLKQPSAQFAAAAFAGLHWSATNLSTRGLYRSQKHLPYLALRFEDFSDDPVGSLRQLEQAFGLDLSRSVEIVQTGALIESGHLSSGNEVRLHAPVRLTNQPPTWKSALPRAAKLGITISTPAAYLYHYSVADWH